VSRYLVLFAREPRREALAKGFGASGQDLFVAFARGWLDLARRARAQIVIATPPEDRPGWRRRLPEAAEALWIIQAGSTFGDRLEGVARRAAKLPGAAVLVGGDVAPSEQAVLAAFAALESGAQAVVGPAPDGGVSLVALPYEDADLLRFVRPRQGRVAERLRRGLEDRGRSIIRVGSAADIDGLSTLVSFERGLGPCATRALIRGILNAAATRARPARERAPSLFLANPTSPRAPPVAA
jgi:glycosyltransferase A (GT-A) superfamily protein (DUF2064 family)